ncbi:ATP-binding protein [Actinoplanes sp. NPDC051851]|uniref:ATP-binding protein n=1 Tax=Actinoplanes sp. NPDC051851 TaxID=3154753 RepID=UPI0034489FF4
MGGRESTGAGPRRYVGVPAAALVVLIGLVATVLVTAGLWHAQQNGAQRVMEQRATMALSAVETETARYQTLLATLAAGIAAGETLTWEDFDKASAPLGDAGLIGAAAVAYVVPVTTDGVAAAQRTWRSRGAAALALNPDAGESEHYFPIFTRILDAGGSSRIGVDLNTVPELVAALKVSRNTGRTAASDTYVLLMDRKRPEARRQQSFVFAAPIWTRANNPEFRGWVVLGLRGTDFLAGVLATASQRQLDAALIATDSDGDEVPLAQLRVPGDADLHWNDPVRVADREWRLELGADSHRLPGAGGALPATVFGSGVTLTALLAWLVYLLAGRRARAERAVEEATADLRSAEEQSRRQAGLLGAIMSSIGDGVSVCDENGRIMLHNPAADAILGTRLDGGPEDWQRRFGLYRPDGRTPFPPDETPLVQGLRGEVTNGVEILVRNASHPEGMLISVDGRPLDPSGGQRGAVAVFRDITELRRYETDLSIFAGVVAHDLKAPLAIARGHAELAREDVEEDAEARGSLDRIIVAVDRMDALIETLLAYSTARDAPLRIADVELEPLVREVLQDRAAAAGAEFTIGPLPVLRADPAMLRHVLDNLIGNAFKYVRPGSVPRADIRAEPDDRPGWSRIEVADAGIGIPDADKSRVFEQFQRAEGAAAYAGTGLGLAICRRIVERHGGRIGVADNPGGGTRFFFTVPTATETGTGQTETGQTETGKEPEMTPHIPPGSKIPPEPAGEEDADVRAALERALAERAAILDSRLPGVSALPAADPSAHDPAAARLRAPVPDHQHQD